MSRLEDVSIFLRVVELGSFARAAPAVGRTSSAISKSVARLEQALGVRLLNRTTRAISLTEEGREYAERCAGLLQGLKEVETAIGQRRGEPAGLLRVDLPVALGHLKIVPALAALTRRHPALRIVATFSDDLSDIIGSGFDVVVRIGEPRDSSLVVRRIGTIRYIVCAAPGYLAARGRPATPEDLLQHECVRRVRAGSGEERRWRFNDPATREPFELAVPGALSLGLNDALIAAALTGTGLVQLHGYMAEALIAEGRLVQVLADYAADGPPLSILYPSSKQMLPKVRAFIDAIAADFAGSSWTEGAPGGI